MKLSLQSRRGSALLLGMTFAIVIAMIAGTYATVSMSSVRMSHRNYHSTAAMNVAETGLEEAMWSINQKIAGNASAFNGWTTSGNDATQTFSGFTFGQNQAGTVKVFVKNYTGSGSPTIVARARLALQTGTDIEKWVEVKLSSRSLFSTGLVAKRSITFSGNNPSVDSWNSDPDNNPATPAIPYSTSVARDSGSVGSVSIDSEISVMNADIWGTAAVGGDSLTAIQVGPNGRVGPYGTASGTKPGASTDFTASLDVTSQPTGSSSTVIDDDTTITGTTDSTQPATKLVYDSLNLSNEVLTIVGNVELILSAGSGAEAIKVSGGSGGIQLGDWKKDASGNLVYVGGQKVWVPGKVTIYTKGNISISGNGVSNGSYNSSGTYVNGLPEDFVIYGTSTSTIAQSISISGNGSLSGVVYAPNADITITGGGNAGSGDVYGSYIGNTIKLTGNTAFHYDESLKDFGTTNPYGITSWRELTSAADRAEYSANL